MAKWTNIRDSFLRSLRTKSGQGAKKSYLYSEHLQFLLKISQKDETESNFRQVQTEDQRNEAEELTDSQLLTDESSNPPTILQTQPTPSTSRSISSERPRQSKSKRQLDDIEREILSELKKGKQAVETCSSASHLQQPRSDQEMLVLSFIPYIRDMTEAELMEFQMEVLTTIKNIKKRRVTTPQPFQQQHSSQQPYNRPQLSPAMSYSDSYQSSLQSFDYQSPPPSNMEQQPEQPPQKMLMNFDGTNKYQQLFNKTATYYDDTTE